MGFFTEEIAIDLGTANTLIIHNDKVVINSPSIVAMDRSTKKNNSYWWGSKIYARKNSRKYQNN